MKTVYLGLGSNAGDSRATLAGAVRELGALLTGLRASSLYRTSPRYVEDQPDFYNMAVSGDTELRPLELLAATQAIEARWGRDRSSERYKGPRTLDIDILLYGNDILDMPSLVVPHPGLAERAFALVPLVEIEPGLRLPTTGLPLSGFLDAVNGQGIYLFAKAPL